MQFLSSHGQKSFFGHTDLQMTVDLKQVMPYMWSWALMLGPSLVLAQNRQIMCAI